MQHSERENNFVTVTLTNEIADTASRSLNENKKVEHVEARATQRPFRELGVLEDIGTNASSDHHH